jgi:hypothetical protein
MRTFTNFLPKKKHSMVRVLFNACSCCLLIAALVQCSIAQAGTRTWDGRYGTDKIEVTVVYFVPSDRVPLIDWRDRVDYYCKRIEQFHQREFQGQSTLKTIVHSEPLVSELSTEQLRQGDANAIYYRTLEESDRRIGFARERTEAFPILLVLSEINWRPLDDFYRLHPGESGLEFEGNYNRGQHFPGAASGGARASYRPRRGVGWGLVSADGWRVPYRGSDCVIYHEGCGHTVGLPHPEPGNGSVMSLGQYRGWISESWLDKDQKSRMKWSPAEVEKNAQLDLFSSFRAIPEPLIPEPGQASRLKLDWPNGVDVASLRVRYQTAVDGPWVEVPQSWEGRAPGFAQLATFDRPTPVSYRVDAELTGGESAELWGYFQVRSEKNELPMPLSLSEDLVSRKAGAATAVDKISIDEIDLIKVLRERKPWSQGQWMITENSLESPKAFGARLELPYTPPEEYRLTLIVEPLDNPNGFLIGNIAGGNRFATLFHYRTPGGAKSAIENIDGRNVGNESTFSGDLFVKGRPSQVIVTVRDDGVRMDVDGYTIVSWKGRSGQLSLSDYWQTPQQRAMFLGAYDCRYRIHRASLLPLKGKGALLEREGDARR